MCFERMPQDNMTPAKSTVYLVDDDVSVCRAIKRLVASAGFRVETFESAAAFLASPYKQEAGCLLLDVQMPGMNGLELQDRLAAESERLPIIIITAHDDESARRRAIQAGAQAYLRKPFDDQALIDAINAALKSAPDATA